jgi:hypothetical protein
LQSTKQEDMGCRHFVRRLVKMGVCLYYERSMRWKGVTKMAKPGKKGEGLSRERVKRVESISV